MQQTQPAVTFEGTDEERQLAEQVFGLARFQGRLFGEIAPIRLRRDALVDFLASREKGSDREALAARLDAALTKNFAVFTRTETDDGMVTYVTTRGGGAPVEQPEDLTHTLAERFMNPAEVPPPPPPKRAPRISEVWTRRPLLDELPEEPEAEEAASAELAALTDVAAAEALAEAPAPASPRRPAPTIEAAPAPSLATAPLEDVRAALAARLAGDDRFAAFGDRYYNEDLVDRYSRGDLRRIREYILELNEPLADDALLQDLFSRRPNDPAYEGARFSINYRLSRERRDYEFVGTRDSRLWSTSGLAPIGTTLRKGSELGQDYRYLLDEPAPAEPVGNAVTHVVTFFEWVYGLLPLDSALRQLFPQPYLEDQKVAVLRFEVPQLYATFLAELRYPTGNRGGYLVGFDEFYRENLVPGAVMTIERTPGNDGQFVVRYTVTAQREERLLQIDERRGRYVFRPQATYCQLDEVWLLSETRYPRLAGGKPLDDRERRRPEVVVGTAFERAADNVGTKAAPRYWSAPEELLPVVNVERPFSLASLREVLESSRFPQFSADPETPGAFFYDPPAKTQAQGASKKRKARDVEDEEDEDEEE